MHSASTRRKAPFVPWMAALLLGATAHAGWFIHDLRAEPEQAPTQISVEIELREAVDQGRLELASPEVLARARARKTTLTPRYRHVPASAGGPKDRGQRGQSATEIETETETEDLDLWIHQIGRHDYSVDRRALDQLALAEIDLSDIERFGAVVERLGLVNPLELRNIRRGTPLYLLGLRNGDRIVAIASNREHERASLLLERRGRRLELRYVLV